MAPIPDNSENLNDTGKSPPENADTRLYATLDDLNLLPSQDMIIHRQRMFELVKSTVQEQQNNKSLETRLDLPFIVVPVGSYGLSVWDASSDIDCLVIGTISPSTFFVLMVEKLRQPGFQGIDTFRTVKTSSDTMLELKVGGVYFYLRYCAATKVTESWPKALQLPSSDAAFELPMQSLLKLNSLRDLDYLQRTIPHLATFRMAYPFIKAWTKSRGIYSPKFGYLGGTHITLLLARVCKLSFAEAPMVSVSDIIRTFFKHYAQFDWKKDMVYDPTYHTNTPNYHRSYREPLVILSVHSPKVNVAQAATVSSVRTLDEEFKRADRLISTPGVTWDDILGINSQIEKPDDFLNAYSNYIKLDIQYWGGAATKGRTLIKWLEFRCVALLADINRKFPDIHARIWPGLFTRMEKVCLENEDEYQGCFLIGLAKNDTVPSGLVKETDRRSAHVSLVALLDKFTEQVRADETYYDDHSLCADAAFVGKSDIEGLRLDDFNSTHVVINQDRHLNTNDDFEESTMDTNGEESQTAKQLSTDVAPSLPTITGGPKLRSASDVLSRLRWDLSFDSADYVIGYVDRFAGEKEVPISLWKSEQTHEEFIPMHRVLYFKRKSDGQRVWDRQSRVDIIFNTGASVMG